MKKRVATIILNRNLPEVTNKLYSMLKVFQKESDFFILGPNRTKRNYQKIIHGGQKKIS